MNEPVWQSNDGKHAAWSHGGLCYVIANKETKTVWIQGTQLKMAKDIEKNTVKIMIANLQAAMDWLLTETEDKDGS